MATRKLEFGGITAASLTRPTWQTFEITMTALTLRLFQVGFCICHIRQMLVMEVHGQCICIAALAWITRNDTTILFQWIDIDNCGECLLKLWNLIQLYTIIWPQSFEFIFSNFQASDPSTMVGQCSQCTVYVLIDFACGWIALQGNDDMQVFHKGRKTSWNHWKTQMVELYV